MKLYVQLARTVVAYNNCLKSENNEWKIKHETRLRELVKDKMPSGSGIDSGTTLRLEASHGEMLVFDADYHHMNEHGMYDGWTAHVIRVRPSLSFGFTVTVSGQNRNDIKAYLAETFQSALNEEVGDL